MSGGPGAQSDASNLLQSAFWARFKSEFGWTAERLNPPAGPWKDQSISVLVRKIGPGLSLAYVPLAPPLPALVGSTDHAADDPRFGESLAHELVELGRNVRKSLRDAGGGANDPICVRFDLPWPSEILPPESVRRLVRAPVDVQPASTVIVDLRQAEDEVLGGMHKKNRYNIRLSERKGVTVRRGAESELRPWYDLYRETAIRDRITIHPFRYYERLMQLSSGDPEVALALYIAEFEGAMLAGIIVARFGERATYLYGASSDAHRNLMPNYALQWTAIRDARAAGASSYDLFGIPPADDPKHPMHGLYRFKVGFGGSIVHRAGSWDVVLSPARYRVYTTAERVRSFYHHRMRKRRAG